MVIDSHLTVPDGYRWTTMDNLETYDPVSRSQSDEKYQNKCATIAMLINASGPVVGGDQGPAPPIRGHVAVDLEGGVAAGAVWIDPVGAVSAGRKRRENRLAGCRWVANLTQLSGVRWTRVAPRRAGA